MWAALRSKLDLWFPKFDEPEFSPLAPDLPEDCIRLVLFVERDQGHRLLFDSNFLSATSNSASDGKKTSSSKRHPLPPNITPMMFGAVPMKSESTITKLHLLKEDPCLLITKLRSVPAPNRRFTGSNRSIPNSRRGSLTSKGVTSSGLPQIPRMYRKTTPRMNYALGLILTIPPGCEDSLIDGSPSGSAAAGASAMRVGDTCEGSQAPLDFQQLYLSHFGAINTYLEELLEAMHDCVFRKGRRAFTSGGSYRSPATPAATTSNGGASTVTAASLASSRRHHSSSSRGASLMENFAMVTAVRTFIMRLKMYFCLPRLESPLWLERVRVMANSSNAPAPPLPPLTRPKRRRSSTAASTGNSGVRESIGHQTSSSSSSSPSSSSSSSSSGGAGGGEVALVERDVLYATIVELIRTLSATLPKGLLACALTAVLSNHLSWVDTCPPLEQAKGMNDISRKKGNVGGDGSVSRQVSQLFGRIATDGEHHYAPSWAWDSYLPSNSGPRLCRTVVAGKSSKMVLRLVYLLSYFIRSRRVECNSMEGINGMEQVIESIQRKDGKKDGREMEDGKKDGREMEDGKKDGREMEDGKKGKEVEDGKKGKEVEDGKNGKEVEDGKKDGREMEDGKKSGLERRPMDVKDERSQRKGKSILKDNHLHHHHSVVEGTFSRYITRSDDAKDSSRSSLPSGERQSGATPPKRVHWRKRLALNAAPLLDGGGVGGGGGGGGGGNARMRDLLASSSSSSSSISSPSLDARVQGVRMIPMPSEERAREVEKARRMREREQEMKQRQHRLHSSSNRPQRKRVADHHHVSSIDIKASCITPQSPIGSTLFGGYSKSYFPGCVILGTAEKTSTLVPLLVDELEAESARLKTGQDATIRTILIDLSARKCSAFSHDKKAPNADRMEHRSMRRLAQGGSRIFPSVYEEPIQTSETIQSAVETVCQLVHCNLHPQAIVEYFEDQLSLLVLQSLVVSRHVRAHVWERRTDEEGVLYRDQMCRQLDISPGDLDMALSILRVREPDIGPHIAYDEEWVETRDTDTLKTMTPQGESLLAPRITVTSSAE